MNTQVHETTGHSPYELVFGQKPHATLFPEGDGTMYINQGKFGIGWNSV